MDMARRDTAPTALTALQPGRAWPLGATVADGGVNFAVFSQHATRIDDMGIGAGRLGDEAVIDQPGIVHPGLTRRFLGQHGIKQLRGLGLAQRPAAFGMQDHLQTFARLGLVHDRRGLGEGEAGGCNGIERREKVAIGRRAARDLQVDPPLGQLVAFDQAVQHDRPVGLVGDPGQRHRAGQPGRMVRPVAKPPVDHRGNLIDPLGEEQAAIEDRHACFGFREKFAVEPDCPHGLFLWPRAATLVNAVGLVNAVRPA